MSDFDKRLSSTEWPPKKVITVGFSLLDCSSLGVEIKGSDKSAEADDLKEKEKHEPRKE